MSTLLSILFLFLILIALPAIVLGWLTESKQQKARRWRRAGLSQQKIANRLNSNRYQVKKLLARAA